MAHVQLFFNNESLAFRNLTGPMALQDLPIELLERTVVLLSLSNICSLRMTNKCLALNTVQKHFKGFFRTKRVGITEQELRTFVAVTAYDGLACLVQDLTLVAPVYNTLELSNELEEKTAKRARMDDNGHSATIDWHDLTEEELQQARLDLEVLKERSAEQLDMLHHQRDVDLLGQAFSNLAAHGASLRMVRTELEIYKDDTTTPLLPFFGGHEKPIWTSIASISHTLFASLAACELPVQSLNLFNSTRMLRCSVPCNDFNSDYFATGRLDASLGHLTELSLRISGKLIERSPGRGMIEDTEDSNFDGLQSMLRTCSRVRKLDLVHFSPDWIPDTSVLCGGILRALGGAGLPCLRSLTLQNFKVTEDELLKLLQGFKAVQGLSLCYIRLTEGSFKRILDYCTMEAAMEEVELDDLAENKMVMFERPWVARPTRVPGIPSIGIYEDTRASYKRPLGIAAGRQIRYFLHHGRAQDSGVIKDWRQDHKNRFGPLSPNGKPSCLQPYVRPEKTWRYR